MLGTFLKGAGSVVRPPQFENFAFTQGSSSSSTLVATAPSSVAEGDFLLWVGTTSSGVTNITFAFPSGWTEIKDQGAPPNFHVAYKIATSSEPSTYTLTASSGASVLAGAILRFTRAAYDTIGATSVSTTTSITANGITVSENKSLRLLLVVINGLNRTFSTPSGTQEILNTGTSDNFGIGVFSSIEDAGSTNNLTTTFSPARNTAAAQMALSPKT
jgi:hypothetical protein